MNKIKIIATIGPSSMKKEVVEKMDKSGVEIFRINLSHTNINDLEKNISLISSWTSKTVAVDTEGAQLRTGLINNVPHVEIKKNSIIEIVGHEQYLNDIQIPINQKSVNDFISAGDLLKIDFDNVIVQIIEIKNKIAIARVIEGGIVYSNKGISTDKEINLPYLSVKDKKAIKIVNKLELNTIFLSFCSRSSDIKSLRKLFKNKIEIIAKVESNYALKNLDEISLETDAILIDRGDLSRDVALEKISFAQSYIIEKAKIHSTPIYIATNLMENMIKYSNPTRAEINDIVKSIQSGAEGLVLAAETAIGKNPVNCVRVLSGIINENRKIKNIKESSKNNDLLDYLLIPPNNGIIEPHGGNLIQLYFDNYNLDYENELASIYVDENIISDVKQISEGTYSPITKFMSYEEVKSVIYENKLHSGFIWTMPITININKDIIKKIPQKGHILLRSNINKKVLAILDIHDICEVKDKNKLAKAFFGTDEIAHPGVDNFINSPDYIICGTPYLIRKNLSYFTSNFNVTPKQTRDVFYHKKWQNIIGFHTRNIPHRGHEYIQKKALERSNADAIFLSPVVGSKKKGDFKSDIIFNSYEMLIEKDYLNPYGVFLGAFNTYSRYAGPKEAIFTAICRKNFGCNYFIIGRDHTGVGNYYKDNAAANAFNEIDIGINILSFNEAYYSTKDSKITDKLVPINQSKLIEKISGTKVREAITKGKKIPDHIIRNEIINEIKEIYNKSKENIFH